MFSGSFFPTGVLSVKFGDELAAHDSAPRPMRYYKELVDTTCQGGFSIASSLVLIFSDYCYYAACDAIFFAPFDLVFVCWNSPASNQLLSRAPFPPQVYLTARASVTTSTTVTWQCSTQINATCWETTHVEVRQNQCRFKSYVELYLEFKLKYLSACKSNWINDIERIQNLCRIHNEREEQWIFSLPSAKEGNNKKMEHELMIIKWGGSCTNHELLQKQHSIIMGSSLAMTPEANNKLPITRIYANGCLSSLIVHCSNRLS